MSKWSLSSWCSILSCKTRIIRLSDETIIITLTLVSIILINYSGLFLALLMTILYNSPCLGQLSCSSSLSMNLWSSLTFRINIASNNFDITSWLCSMNNFTSISWLCSKNNFTSISWLCSMNNLLSISWWLSNNYFVKVFSWRSSTDNLVLMRWFFFYNSCSGHDSWLNHSMNSYWFWVILQQRLFSEF